MENQNKKDSGRFSIGVNALIEKGNSILVLKRSLDKKYWPGLWNLPGGNVEFGEKPEKAVVREVKEETNLSVILTGKLIDIFTYFDNKHKRETVVISYECIKPKGTIKLDVAHSEYRWVMQKNWEDLQYTPSARQALNKHYGK